MILNPYKFLGHTGWQGTGHCSVILDNGQFYIIHQGRPVADKYMMVCHVRKINWINGWPVVSPERYGGTPFEDPPPVDSLMTTRWEHMILEYSSSFALDVPTLIELKSDGTISGDTANRWSYSNGQLSLRWNNNQVIDTCKVWYEWDWEKRKVGMIYSGHRNTNICVWGKSTTQALPSTIDDNYIGNTGSTVEVYPNPARNGFFHIALKNITDNELVVNILNSNSTLLRSVRVNNSGNIRFAADGLNGLYLIQVITKMKVYTKRIVALYP